MTRSYEVAVRRDGVQTTYRVNDHANRTFAVGPSGDWYDVVGITQERDGIATNPKTLRKQWREEQLSFLDGDIDELFKGAAHGHHLIARDVEENQEEHVENLGRIAEIIPTQPALTQP